MLKDKKVTVTGAGGFIGSHLTERLLRHKAHVTALVRYTSTGRAGWLEYLPPSLKKEITILYGDIRDPDICRQAAAGSSQIFHLAAQIAIPYSYIAPRDFLEVNGRGTINMLQAAREAGVKRFLHVSTSEVYGTARYLPMDENHPQTAQSPYAASKIAADRMVEAFYHSYALPTVIARPFNCYGPRQSARAVVPTIILQAMNGRTIRLGRVDTCRDLNYVADIVDGMIGTAAADVAGKTLNLASGDTYAVKDIVSAVGDIMGKKLRIVTEKRRLRPGASEVLRLQGDASRAEELTGYRRRHSLTGGLEKTIAFYNRHRDLFKKEDYQI